MNLFEIRNLSFSYPGYQKFLNIEELNILQNRITVFSGPNGSGKTTLLKLLGGYIKGGNGNIKRNIDLKSISYLPQEPYLLKRSLKSNIEYGLKIQKIKNRESKIDEALDIVGLSDKGFKDRKWYELSGGEKKRAALAARLVLEPKVLLLDEPSESVDSQTKELLGNAVDIACTEKGISFIISSHDRLWANNIGQDFFSVIKGRVFKGGFFNIKDNSLAKNRLFASFFKENVFFDKIIINPGDIKIFHSLEKRFNFSLSTCFSGVVESCFLQNLGILYLVNVCGEKFYVQDNQKSFFPGDDVFLGFDVNKFIWI